MLTTTNAATTAGTAIDRKPDLQWVGEGAWVASDPAADTHDPHRVIAYLECKDSRVYVLWVSGAAGVCEFESLRAALAAIGERLASAAV